MSKTDSSKSFVEKIRKNYDSEFYKIMAENFGEEILVTDGDGRVLFANPASCETMKISIDKLVGMKMTDLEKEGFISKSASLEVIKSKKQVNILQKVKDGRVFLTTGVPIFDSNNTDIIMVIITSKDVEEISTLMSTLEKQTEEIKKNKEVIRNLQETMLQEEGFISADPAMTKLIDTLLKIAPMDLAVLIEGETGVGKEVAVRVIHKFSKRHAAPFVKINCGNIPENLIESEFFGYEKGAFTGAEKEGKKGRVELAEGGTLFLDEIGELPLQLQTKLLDFLQDGTFVKVGGIKKNTADVRIVTATNRDLKKMCEEGTFRRDLYYRLNVFPVKIMPLRDRPMDIEALTRYYISQYNSKYNMHKSCTKDFLVKLKAYSWPGNVRELQHVLERVYIISDTDMMSEEDLNDMFENGGIEEESKIICNDLLPLKEAKAEIEKQLITKAYKIYKSSYKVAEALEVGQSTAARLLQKYR